MCVCVDKDDLTPRFPLVQYEVFQSYSHEGVMDSSDTAWWLPLSAIASVNMCVALGVARSWIILYHYQVLHNHYIMF